MALEEGSDHQTGIRAIEALVFLLIRVRSGDGQLTDLILSAIRPAYLHHSGMHNKLLCKSSG